MGHLHVVYNTNLNIIYKLIQVYSLLVIYKSRDHCINEVTQGVKRRARHFVTLGHKA